jgi:hypothetical protein
MTEQPTPPPRRNLSRFIPLIIITISILLVITSAIVTRQVDEENKNFELNVTKTIQTQIEIATGTAQGIQTLDASASQTPRAEMTVTPQP